MRRGTYIELMVAQLEILKKETKTMVYREKLEVMCKLYEDALTMMASKMTDDELRANISAQECGLVSMFLRQFLKGHANCYKIARSFGSHLNKTKLDVPTSVMPKKLGKTYMIEFPDGIEFHGPAGEIYHSCIVAIGMYGTKPEKGIFKSIGLGILDEIGFTLQVCAPDITAKEMTASISVMDIGSKETIQDSIDLFVQRHGEMHFPHEMINYIAKCLLYIESGEPDLKNDGVMSVSKNLKKQKSMAKKDLYPFPLVRVGYGFHHREYHVGSTMVRGFFRWQSYSPQHSKVKLIWIDEHPRHYNKGQ